ncbi:MAG: EAL domain-containing protein [Oscillospiraceae bacterium]|nr:EAL domain-containing protein [Oscillospiraceae bacterium]
MSNNQEQTPSPNNKPLILIVDDEQINAMILGANLEKEYNLLYAADGSEALELMRAHCATLSLVLLDLMMPVMSGFDVLEAVRDDDDLKQIPIIVATSDAASEARCLQLGAIDFLSKPYPVDMSVPLARIRRIIELKEDRSTIQSTERDELTGLYNKEFFFYHAEQLDLRNKDLNMDAIIVDVNHFHMINERYGKAYGDEVLRRISQNIRETVFSSGGIVCRRDADTFMAYCPHREDYQEILDRASAGFAGDTDTSATRVRLRMGVYSNVDKTIDLDRRFDRAKMAADTVRGSFTRTVGLYDDALHEKNLFAEQLIEDFSSAIEERQFRVYYQPKFDVRPDTPVLAGAEALVRWIHPRLGMVSPGAFIPLFEENGLIQRLDYYVWQEAARQIREWKDRFGYAIPVSVNVSRIDMFDPQLPSTLQEIVREHGLACSDLHLEVTESAYTQDSGQIIRTVEQLRNLGFHIEMDDFGSGYSSLNMVSTLPIDTLKLDMQFIRNAFKPEGNVHMLEIIIEIARYLMVPIIAEGVETEAQFDTLKKMGCDLVQGYFFSKPVPAAEFEAFILQKKEADKSDVQKQAPAASRLLPEDIIQSAAHNPPPQEPAEPEAIEETAEPGIKEKPHDGIQLKTANLFFLVLAVLAAVTLFISDLSVTNGYRRMERASDRYISAEFAASDMESGSDYLTDRVRCFVVTGDIEYLKDFFEEVNVTRRRDLAVENLEQLLNGRDATALSSLNTALALSNELVSTEYLAMRMALESGNYDPADIPEEIASIRLSEEDLRLTPDELKEKAESLVFDNNYMHYKDRIRENVNLCTQALIHSSSQELEKASAQMSLLVRLQTFLTILFLAITLGIVIFVSVQIRKPLTKMVEKMRAQEMMEPTGAEELRFVTRTYNTILDENRAAREKLSHEASHDALTGLFNRGAYDLLMKSVDTSHMALLIIDIDYFKSVNDTYGHAVGDRVLKRVAEILQHSFRSVDIICRIGGDEFVVVMTRVNSSMAQLVRSKISRANDLLLHPKDDLPPVSLSVGVAFSDRDNPQGDIFTDADTALYRVKEAGRNGCAIY